MYKLRDMVNYEDELVQNLLRIRVALLREQCVYNTKYKKQHCLAMWDAVFIKCVTVWIPTYCLIYLLNHNPESGQWLHDDDVLSGAEAESFLVDPPAARRQTVEPEQLPNGHDPGTRWCRRNPRAYALQRNILPDVGGSLLVRVVTVVSCSDLICFT